MTIREGLHTVKERLTGFVNDRRRPRTHTASHHQESRHLPPTNILLSEQTTTNAQELLASLPNRAATCALEDKPGATPLYYKYQIKPVNEFGNQRHIITVQNREYLVDSPQSNTVYALYTIDISKAVPGRKQSFTFEAQYVSNIPQDVSFRPFDFNEDGQQYIPPDRSSLFRFHFEDPEHPSLNMVTVSYAAGVDDEQPDADIAIILRHGQHEPVLQYVLGQLNVLTQLATE